MAERENKRYRGENGTEKETTEKEVSDRKKDGSRERQTDRQIERLNAHEREIYREAKRQRKR